jgi:hypothetical protein
MWNTKSKCSTCGRRFRSGEKYCKGCYDPAPRVVIFWSIICYMGLAAIGLPLLLLAVVAM